MAGYAGRQGRKPLPTALKVMRGNPGKRPLNDAEPVPDPAMPTCPPQLTGAAREEWERVGTELLKLGLISQLDRGILTVYCDAWGRWVEAKEALEMTGMVVMTRTGYPVPSPYLTIANRSLEIMQKAAVEFGMSPSSRSRVKATPVEEDDEFEELFGRRAARRAER